MSRPSFRSADIAVPMLDPRPLHAELREELDAAIAGVIDSGKFILGDAVERFEAKAADYLGVAHAVGVASGTDALLLALRAAGIGEDDEVITTPFSFWATAEAIHRVGARAVFVDIDAAGMNIDATKIEAAITPKTRAILPVHLFGQAADMPAINEIAQRYDLVVIEDAAQAFDARISDRCAGSWGSAGCCSFHPAKPFGAFGDGGMVITNDDGIAATVRRLRNHGAAARYRHVDFAYNSRLDSLQAAVLEVKLAHLDAHLAERRRLAGVYDELLEPMSLQLPVTLPGREHVYAQYTIRTERRDELRVLLRQEGVESAVHYPAPLYRQPAWRARYRGLSLPVVEATCGQCLSLPLYYGLSRQQQEHVAGVIRRHAGSGVVAHRKRV